MNLLKNLWKTLWCVVLGAMLLASANAEMTFIYNDPWGNPVVTTDIKGNVKWKATYLPYGEQTNGPAANEDNRIGFAGKPFDQDTGLSYLGARSYDSRLGRFTGFRPTRC